MQIKTFSKILLLGVSLPSDGENRKYRSPKQVEVRNILASNYTRLWGNQNGAREKDLHCLSTLLLQERSKKQVYEATYLILQDDKFTREETLEKKGVLNV